MAALAAVGARAAGMLATFVSIPVALNYLGREQYGLWLSISSAMAVLSFADLGLGYGLVTSVSQADGRSDMNTARRLIAGAAATLTLVSAGALLAGVVATQHFPWALLLRDSTLPVDEVRATAVAVAVCVTFGVPLSIVQRVQTGAQAGHLAHLWSGAGALCGMAALILATHAGADLPLLVFAQAGTPLVVAALNTVWYFGRRRPDLRPGRSEYILRNARGLIRTGAGFMSLQIIALFAFQCDAIIIASVLGADRVADYAVPARLFTVVTVLVSVLAAPLWPAYGEAHARGDLAWIHRTFRRSVAFTVALAATAASALAVAGPWILRIWVGPAVTTSSLLLWALAVWSVVLSVYSPIAMLLNGLGLLRLQVICGALMAVVNVTLSILLARRLGPVGPVLGSIAAQTAFVMVPTLVYCRTVLRGAAGAAR